MRELIQHFGLQTIPMDAEQVHLDGELLNDVPGMRRKYGAKTADAIEAFRKRCTEMVSPTEYYEGVGAHDNEHPWAYITAEELLDREVDDATAKRFFKVMARSDIATEPHNTNGLNALKNFVMDVDGYIGLYSIQNGNEQLIECLQSEVDADIQLNHRVLKVGKTEAGRYQLNMMNGKGPETRDFDLVLMCLPHSWLATMRWDGEQLRKSMVKHVAYFDRPAHYLRVSILFDAPFWGDKIPGSWFMSEAFGGCCVYNEGSRHDVGKHGVLNWLIAGSDALAFANLGDQELIDAALKSLPASFGDARAHFLEGKTHRWLSSVNALPGGMPARDVMTNHRPDPKQHPGLVVVGDYLFDSDAERIAGFLRCRHRHHRHRNDAAAPRARRGRKPASDKIDRGYFENYRGLGPYSEVWSQFTDPAYLTDLIKIVWSRAKGYKLLVAGSASGELVGALRARGIDAWGIENNRAIHAKTPKELKKFNKLGSILDMPFKDGEFDFVFETSLCHVTEKQVAARHSRAQPRRQDRRDIRIGDLGHGAGADRSLRPVTRGQEARHLVGMVGIVFLQRIRPVDASPRLHRRAVGGDACRQQGSRPVVCGLRQSSLLVLRQGRGRGRLSRSRSFLRRQESMATGIICEERRSASLRSKRNAVSSAPIA